ncbi:MAG: DUF3106 domain-containing protein [Arenimonas sp.]
MKINMLRTLPLLVFVLITNAAQAQVQFRQLPAQEQNLLKAAESLWPQLDSKAQAQLRAQAQHWMKLPAGEQQTLLLKQRQWDSLSFSDKASERARFAAWQSLGAIDQAKINAAYRKWRSLPVDKQQSLKAKFSQQLPEYQQAWILGPTLGKEAQVLNEWLLFTPQEQIKPWLMLLRQLGNEDRTALVTLGKRWKQQERDTFRTRLLSAPQSARADMIQAALVR